MIPNRTVCEAVVRQLWPYLDGAVSEEQRELIVGHLELCVNCASHFDFAQAFLDAVAAAGRSHLPVDESLRSRVLGALTASGFSLGDVRAS
jgi:anti-sigma factor (TIGR02949 family)